VLFTKSTETSEHGFIDDNIPVERSGPRADEIPVLNNFAELVGQVPPYITRAIQLMGYATPTPIQKHAVPLGLAGVDLMCCAQTVRIAALVHCNFLNPHLSLYVLQGSGKTFSFLLPVVTAMDRQSLTRVPAGLPPKDNLPSSEALTDAAADTPDEQQSTDAPTGANFQLVERVSIDQRGALPVGVVLAPTRELASQIHLDARRLMFGSNLKTVCVYGGNDLRMQLQELSTGCDLIVATPGRLNDLVERGCVSLSQVTLLVLDEADRMLDMGFEVSSSLSLESCVVAVAHIAPTWPFRAAPNPPHRD
jgi:ATP-dependent RNA helicase DDX3X